MKLPALIRSLLSLRAFLAVSLLAAVGMLLFLVLALREIRTPDVMFVEDSVEAQVDPICPGDFVIFESQIETRYAPTTPLFAERWFHVASNTWYPGAVIGMPIKEPGLIIRRVASRAPLNIPPGAYLLERGSVSGFSDVLVVSVVVRGDCT